MIGPYQLGIADSTAAGATSSSSYEPKFDQRKARLSQKSSLLEDLVFAPQALKEQAMADLLLKEHGRAEKVGRKWAYNFEKRQEQVVSPLSRRFDHKAEAPEVIQD